MKSSMWYSVFVPSILDKKPSNIKIVTAVFNLPALSTCVLLSKEESSKCTLNRQTCPSEAAQFGGNLRKWLPALLCKSCCTLSKQRTEKRLWVPTVGSVPACLVLQSGSRQWGLAGSLWVWLSKVNLPSFLEWHVRDWWFYIHVRRSRCLPFPCIVLHLELQLHIQFHKTNPGSCREEWVALWASAALPLPFWRWHRHSCGHVVSF